MAEKSGKQRAKAAPAEAFRRPDAPDPAAASASFAGERERELSTLFDTLPGMVYRCANDRQWTMEFVSASSKHSSARWVPAHGRLLQPFNSLTMRKTSGVFSES